MEQFAVDFVRHYKERLVASGDPQDDDICPVVIFVREDAMFVAIAGQVDRDQGLHLVRMGASGFNAQKVAFITDAHFASDLINPQTGKEWGPNEMQNFCDNENGCALGVITDCIFLIERDRHLGWMSFTNLPYHVNKTLRHVCWHERQVQNMDTELGLTGIVPESIDDSFALTPLAELDEVEEVSRLVGGNHPPAQQVIDKITSRMMSDVGASVRRYSKKPVRS